jgi:hypothetical protein
MSSAPAPSRRQALEPASTAQVRRPHIQRSSSPATPPRGSLSPVDPTALRFPPAAISLLERRGEPDTSTSSQYARIPDPVTRNSPTAPLNPTDKYAVTARHAAIGPLCRVDPTPTVTSVLTIPIRLEKTEPLLRGKDPTPLGDVRRRLSSKVASRVTWSPGAFGVST